MATWDELVTAIRAGWTPDRDDDDALTVTVAHGPRAQRVMIRRYEALGEVLVEFRSAFTEARALGAASLLESNLTLPLGAVAQHGRFLVIVQKAVLTHTTVEGLLFLLTRVSMLADVLEQREGTDRF